MKFEAIIAKSDGTIVINVKKLSDCLEAIAKFISIDELILDLNYIQTT